ncbi:hypothetical protein [Prosthecobacter sp.]|uniref:hypothetical protein n=1 Tax=Prosthecobacter sp. TaxID=1965333 RepID=UPI00248858E4|nr:hypothetical protein [Prosthecobacter sp.]MDI1315259.1 hypothetical protein [Prosthecobacter sp.]
MPDVAGILLFAAACCCGAKAFGAGASETKAFWAGGSACGAASFILETKEESNGIACCAVAISEGADAFCCDEGVNKVEMDD